MSKNRRKPSRKPFRKGLHKQGEWAQCRIACPDFAVITVITESKQAELLWVLLFQITQITVITPKNECPYNHEKKSIILLYIYI